MRVADGTLATDVHKDDIVIREDGHKVEELEIFAPRAALTTVLAMDISGSMENPSGDSGIKKIDEAKKAAGIFLDHLSTSSETGLILFDHRCASRNLLCATRPGTPPTAKRSAR